jgi:hypothetical protein
MKNALKWSINKKEWNETIDKYVAFTKKSAEEATFRQAKNLLFFIAKQMPQSRFKKGEYVTRLSDYFKYRPWVAGMVVAKYFKRKNMLVSKPMHKRNGVIGTALMIRGSNGRTKFAKWKMESKTRYFTREMAIKENERRRRMINARFGFAQLIPMKAIEALKTTAKKYGINIGSVSIKAKNKPNKKWMGENAMVKVSKSGSRVDLSVVSAYTYKSQKTMFGKSQDANARFYDDAIKAALPRALAKTIADIKDYMSRKMAERAKRMR